MTICPKCRLCPTCTYPLLKNSPSVCQDPSCTRPSNLPSVISAEQVFIELLLEVAHGFGLLLPTDVGRLIVSAAFPDCRFLVEGSQCFATDYVRYTYCAKLERIVAGPSDVLLYVTYAGGWLSRWNEWIPYKSKRVTPHVSHPGIACSTPGPRNQGKKQPFSPAYFCAHQKFCAVLGFPQPWVDMQSVGISGCEVG